MSEPYVSTSRLADVEEALLSVDRLALRQLVLEAGGPELSLEAMETLLVPVFENIGRGWESGRVSLAQVYMSGRLCEELVDSLPNLPIAETAARNLGHIAVAVLEDSHMLGQRIVYSALRVAGFPVARYGSLSVDQMVARVVEDRTRVLLVSVLMLPSALRVRTLVDRLREVSPETLVIVGGAPFRFDPALCDEVGAHGCGVAATDAVTIVRKLAGGVGR